MGMAGLTPEHRKYGPTDYQRVITLRQMGLSQRAIAEQTGISKSTVHLYCQQANVAKGDREAES
jgi:DNA-binding NarL/FixJ family response regulator